MCRWKDILNRFGFRWVPSLETRVPKELWVPLRILLVQQLSVFQRAPQGYLKELFISKRSIAHIYVKINPSCVFAFFLTQFYVKTLF